MGLFGRTPESKITQANVDILQKLDLIRHSLESARSALPLPECAELANDLKAELEVKFTSFFAILCIYNSSMDVGCTTKNFGIFLRFFNLLGKDLAMKGFSTQNMAIAR